MTDHYWDLMEMVLGLELPHGGLAASGPPPKKAEKRPKKSKLAKENAK